jgi:hypothetical protein
VQNAVQTVYARVRKTYDLTDAALVLRGRGRAIMFRGAAFSLSGLDHDLQSGAPIGGSKPRLAISVSTAELHDQIIDASDTRQRANFHGDDGTGRMIAVSEQLQSDDIERIASEICISPQAVVSEVPSSGSLAVAGETWGSRVVPEVRCVRGLPRTGDFVDFTGHSQGAGILVIKDAEVVLSGSFRWEGWVIVIGNDVGLRVVNSEPKTIFGGVIVCESGNGSGTGPALLDLEGNFRLAFSRQAFDLSAALLPTATLNAARPSLPFWIGNDYWRSINP